MCSLLISTFAEHNKELHDMYCLSNVSQGDEMADACCVFGLEEKSVQSFERKCEGNCHSFSKCYEICVDFQHFWSGFYKIL